MSRSMTPLDAHQIGVLCQQIALIAVRCDELWSLSDGDADDIVRLAYQLRESLLQAGLYADMASSRLPEGSGAMVVRGTGVEDWLLWQCWNKVPEPDAHPFSSDTAERG